jgi:hypothetical protein
VKTHPHAPLHLPAPLRPPRAEWGKAADEWEREGGFFCCGYGARGARLALSFGPVILPEKLEQFDGEGGGRDGPECGVCVLRQRRRSLAWRGLDFFTRLSLLRRLSFPSPFSSPFRPFLFFFDSRIFVFFSCRFQTGYSSYL